MNNRQVAEQLIARLVALGVREACLCTGARNAPLVEAVANCSDLKVYSFFDERTAAFFALGRARANGRPVVVCTTSGTAVAELLPATIEARYVGAPLILLTADRPKRFRNSGAPQTIDQVSFLKSEVGEQWDLETWPIELEIKKFPAHINICLEEPVFTANFEASRSDNPTPSSDFSKVKSPLIVVGALEKSHRPLAMDFLKKCPAARILEAHSGLSHHQDLASALEINGKWISPSVFREHFDGVIRIGGIPTMRLWRDLEYDLRDVPVLSFCEEPWSGLGREMTPARQIKELQNLKIHIEPPRVESWISVAKKWQDQCEKLASSHPRSELALVRELSATIPQNARVMIGNSLPVREWDLVATKRPDLEVITQRGVNGIDGLLSTFLGMCGEGENVILVGDLSAFYDANAFWVVRHLPKDIRFKIVVLNNRGGRIFRRMFALPELELEHGYDFQSFSQLWNLNYVSVDEASLWPQVWKQVGSRALIEVQPQLLQSDAAWDVLERFQLS